MARPDRDNDHETSDPQIPNPKSLGKGFIPYRYPTNSVSDPLPVACRSRTMTSDRRANQKKCDPQENCDGGAPEVDGPGEAGEAAAQSFGRIVFVHGALLHAVIGLCWLMGCDLTH